MTTTAPYGTWESPLQARDTIASLVRFGDLTWDGQSLLWTEMRPAEAGRQVLVRHDDGTPTDVTPPPFQARTRVHEYGGGSLVADAGRLTFSNFSDQRLYTVTEAGIDPLTQEPPRPAGVRFADGRYLADGSLVCVRETHPAEGEAVNEVVLVGPDGDARPIAAGCDFYASPRPSPDGERLLWLEWDHPNMPWDGTRLRTRRIDGQDEVVTVAGGPDESIFQPEWDGRDSIVFASDRTGWWNLYRSDGGGPVPITEMEADIGDPAWVFGRSSFGFLSSGRILFGFWDDGVHRLALVDGDGLLVVLEDDLTSHDQLITDGRSRAWFVGTGPETPSSVFELDVDRRERRVIRANPSPVPAGFAPPPRTITFPTADGAVAHGIFYPPTNPDYTAPDGESPPLIVTVHGGPTSHAYPRLSPGFAYWTSRGFALVDVNYRGSTGYGRRYRNLLRDNWGIHDVEDCLAAARHLAAEGFADGERLIITGGSAGGYTTLAALAFGDAFDAGASYFGVADLGLLAAHTHKFESRYLDGLVGTDPEEMRRRSPLHSCHRISVPVILFQGLDDEVVPPEQAEMIAAALASNGVPHAHVTYPGEDHGFRKAENIIHSLETELAFYGEVLGFRPAGDLPEVPLVTGPA